MNITSSVAYIATIYFLSLIHIRTLANETSDTQTVGADAVVVTEGAAVLAGDQGLDVAAHGARHPVLGEGRRLGQQRHAGGLEQHLVPLVGGLDGGGGGLHSDNLALSEGLGLGGGEGGGCVVSTGALQELLAVITHGALLSRVLPLEDRTGAFRHRMEFLIGDHQMSDPIIDHMWGVDRGRPRGQTVRQTPLSRGRGRGGGSGRAGGLRGHETGGGDGDQLPCLRGLDQHKPA